MDEATRALLDIRNQAGKLTMPDVIRKLDAWLDLYGKGIRHSGTRW